MRQLADRYRDLFPALILGYVFSEESGHYRHAWIEVVPGPTPDSYAVVPGARSGSLTTNYALEENNSAVGAGTVVWMRHRDEQGQLHYAFLAPQSSRIIIFGPPGGGGDSGSGPGGGGGGGPGGGTAGDLCISITPVGEGCECLALRETLTVIFADQLWSVDVAVCGGVPLQIRLEVTDVYLEWLDGGGVTEGPFTLAAIPGEIEVELDNPACSGTVRIAVARGGCDPGGGGGGGGGGGDCTQIIGGRQCFDCDYVATYCNVVPTPFVSAVCPIYSDLVGGDGILIERTAEGEITISADPGGPGGGRVAILTGLVVQSQVLQLPAGLVVGDPECRSDPADCCPSGSGTAGGAGCCWPRPPDVLYAAIFGATARCDCLLACVTLLYDGPLDAWFSTEPIAEGCGHSGDRFLRLKCYGGSYHLDVVDPAHAVVLEGQDYYGPHCEPFLYAATFDDPEATTCEASGGFGYLISDSDCAAGSGSGDGGGGGGTVLDSCCGDVPVPETLYVRFGGALAALGTVAIVHDGDVTWRGHSDACGGNDVAFFCLLTPQFTISLTGGCVFGAGLEAASDCDPFLCEFSGTSSGACAGAATASVSATP